jgi:molybdopterin/thiamine biosynthesis adenylyltransferase
VRNKKQTSKAVPSRYEFEAASAHYPAEFDRRAYFERTARNQFWVNGEIGQERIRKLKIAVAGLGGMGGQIADSLARVGVGHLRIADPDHVELTNINRQLVATQETIGQSKTEVAEQQLRRVSKDFELVAYRQGVCEEMIEEFVEGCDAIVDEIDVFALDKKVLLHRAARKRGIPLYSAYIIGLGTHFYKFHGEQYTLEHFLNEGPEVWKKPSADYLLERFGQPFTRYIDAETKRRYSEQIATRGTPIFGPAALLGQSLVTTRLIVDLLHTQGVKMFTQPVPKTPVMPEFLVLDPVDLTFRKSTAD